MKECDLITCISNMSNFRSIVNLLIIIFKTHNVH